jgi:hypothetical protein
MKSAMTTVIDRTNKLSDALLSLTKKDVYVGIPQDNNTREANDSSFGNAAIGWLNQRGSPLLNIPARPHLDVGIVAAQERITNVLRTAGKAALDGDTAAAEAGLMAAGQIGADSVRKTILDVIPPSLADDTLAARRRRGHESETPLNETGEYRNNITYVLRDRDG